MDDWKYVTEIDTRVIVILNHPIAAIRKQQQQQSQEQQTRLHYKGTTKRHFDKMSTVFL